MGGIILGPCSPDRRVNGFRKARLTDMTIGWCGHIGIIVSGSPDTITNGLLNARIYDFVCSPCNIGVLVSGSLDTFSN